MKLPNFQKCIELTNPTETDMSNIAIITWIHILKCIYCSGKTEIKSKGDEVVFHSDDVMDWTEIGVITDEAETVQVKSHFERGTEK